MTKHRTIAIFALALLVCATQLDAEDTSSQVRVVPRGNGYALLRNGQPFFIKGAGGASNYLDVAVSAGANSVREWSVDEALLDRAGAQGLTALVGLAVGIPRHGFDYTNAQAVREQLEKVIATVHRLKSNPAVLIWALGNEVELNATDAQRIAAWQALEQLAQAVKREDPNHPVIVVLAGPGKNKLRELDQYCPTLDAVGINTYGGILTLPESVAAQDFRRPYIVTEYGPRGHWEVPKSAWGMPIEDTSSEKADLILKGYDHAIANQPQCLGSYVFLWGQKQEKTHTWYGLFLPNGDRLGGVDAMQYLWTGSWPPHRCPVIRGTIMAKGGESALHPGAIVECSIDATDPSGDPMTFAWEVRPDVANNPSTGGDFEPPAPVIPGAVQQMNGSSAMIQVPSKAGDYRIFVYVYNGYKGAATANLPIEVQ